MKNYIKITISAVMLLFALQCYSQISTEDQNEMKYWVWRDRLVNDFMIPGNSAGCGIILTERGGRQYPNGYGGFDISDEGWPLGYYLAVLATEWKLLNDAGQSTTKTEIELYYALQTLNRLDNDAENYWIQYWGNSTYYPWGNDNPNGFMIRDDVFDDFISSDPSNTIGYNNFMHFNSDNGNNGKYVKEPILPIDNSGGFMSLQAMNAYNLTQNWGYSSAAEEGIHTSYDLGYGWVTGPEEFSQDNYIGLMIGLCTISKLIPSNYTIHSPDDCSKIFNIKNEAGNILSRIIYFMYNSYNLYYGNNSINPKYQHDDCTDDCWHIVNPITGMCVKGTNWKDFLTDDMGNCNICMYGGAVGRYWSYAYSRINNTWGSSDGSLDYCAVNSLWFTGMTNQNWKDAAVLLTLDNEDVTGWSDNNDATATYWLVNENTDYNSQVEYYFLDLLSLLNEEKFKK